MVPILAAVVISPIKHVYKLDYPSCYAANKVIGILTQITCILTDFFFFLADMNLKKKNFFVHSYHRL